MFLQPEFRRQVFERYEFPSDIPRSVSVFPTGWRSRVSRKRINKQEKEPGRQGRTKVLTQYVPRNSFGPYPFHAVVVSLARSSRNVQLVAQLSMRALNPGGKSDPMSTIQETLSANRDPAARRAPMAAYVPAPPMIRSSGLRPSLVRYSILSARSKRSWLLLFSG